MPRRHKPDTARDPELSPLLDKLLSALKPAELEEADSDALFARIQSYIEDNPPPGTYTIRAAEMTWTVAGPGVEVKMLRMDRERNNQTVLIRMHPGAVVVGHRHTQEEECLVLEGEVFLGKHRLQAGDMHVARPGVVHEPIRAPHGALLLIRSEMPPQNFRISGA